MESKNKRQCEYMTLRVMYSHCRLFFRLSVMCGRRDVMNRRRMVRRRRVMVLRRLVVMVMPGRLVRRLRGIDEGFAGNDGRHRPARAHRPAASPLHGLYYKWQGNHDNEYHDNGNDPIHSSSPFPVSTIRASHVILSAAKDPAARRSRESIGWVALAHRCARAGSFAALRMT
jgi:hypothetical protein